MTARGNQADDSPSFAAQGRVLGPVGLLAVVVLAAGLRILWLDRPRSMIWDENFYVPDACTYLGMAADLCEQSGETTFVHPPLAKWLIATGIELLGYDAWGWRAAACAAGTATVLATYLLGRAVGATRWAALLAAAVLALDPLHIVFSRTATLDSFVTLFGVLMVLTAVRDNRADRASALYGWRPVTGLLVGAAVATKWSAVLLVPLVIAIILLGDRRRRATRARSPTTRERWAIRLSFLASAGLLVGAYVTSYVGRLQTRGDPWAYGGFLRQLVRRHEAMLRFHLGVDTDLGTHPNASPAWSWPLAKRPPVLAFDASHGLVQETLGLVDPLILVPGICLAVWTLGRYALGRRNGRGNVAAAAALSCWLPWIALGPDRAFVFAYYLLPSIPFLAILLAQGVEGLHTRHPRGGAVAGCLVLGTCSALLVWFWPLLTSAPLTYDDWRQRILVEQCGGEPPRMPDGRIGPASGEGPPSSGWCWL